MKEVQMRKSMKYYKFEMGKRGITLIALVITIIVLLILAGVTISALSGDNGILLNAAKAREETEATTEEEKIQLAIIGSLTENDGKEIIKNILESELEKFFKKSEYTVTEGTNDEGDEGFFTMIAQNEKESRTHFVDKTGKLEKILGNAKEIANNANETYGALVTNYDIDNDTTVDWKIFYSDGINVYLIADDYIDTDILPVTVTNNKPNQSSSYNSAAYFTDILSDYIGSDSISDNNPAYKWLKSYYERGYTSINKNMKAVAYMMDTNIWDKFKKNTSLYATGGPTLEMLLASYNHKYGTQYECQATNEMGYELRKTSDEAWSDRITGMLNTTDSLYTISNQTNALSYWIATPSVRTNSIYDIGNNLISVYYSGSITYSFYNATDIGFRPVVCLNSNIKLVKQPNGEYQIQ